ncbi:TolC family outer membrane protein [Falsigemmobacter intermedius]|uniref:Transporter n=1 Tax=Falsigemmobacter intermedius TaxID=1553448 RepID=A0A444MCB7_9RHOB|nr:TolC family outer membrane protein [Falsigemmobacter intermedius]RWY41664.1 transporter [Falsigemmobacter intermedius]
MVISKARTLMMGLAAAVMTAAPVFSETLGDALVLAYRNSQLLEQNRALLRATDEGVARSVAALRPTIDFVLQSGYAKNDVQVSAGPGLTRQTRVEALSTTASLTASLVLYNGGASRLAVQAAKESVLATRQALIGVEQNVLLSAVQAYMRLRLAQDIVALRQGNVRVLAREMQAATDRFELGEITRTDVALAEARLAAARAQLTAAEGDVLVGRETYQLAVGQAPGRLSAPPRQPVTARSVEEAKRIARQQHYAIRQMQHQLAAADLNVKIAEAAMGPNIALSAGLSHDNQGMTDRTLGLRLSQPIYRGGALSSEHRRAIANRDAVRAQLHHTVAQVEQAVGEAWAMRLVTSASITAMDRQITAARAAYDGVREETRLGARTTLDLLNAEQELLSAQASRLEAVTSQYVANYSLLAAMGYLTVDHLKLGIPTYDVSAYYNAVKSAPVTSPQGQRLDRILQSSGRK